MPAANPQDAPDFTFPSRASLRRYTALARVWFAPQFLGLWELDLERPALFVGNHTLFGLTDVPLMVEHLYTQYGVVLRSLGDRGHFQIPIWGDVLRRHGMVLGDPKVCSELMQANQHILVFPGGGREVMRRKNESYSLLWKQRTGFARLAIEHGYDIIPFGSVGPNESYRILLDANDMLKNGKVLSLAKRTGLFKATRDGELIPPLVRGIGPTLLPRPQRYYFGFGQRISTEHLQGQHNDKEAVWAMRETVATAIREQIERLHRYRQEDHQQNWSRLRRWLAPINHSPPKGNNK